MFDHSIWIHKARAFVTRSHRHLWGKNNEDPQAFLFTRGLKNAFIKQQIIGWNKFSQERPTENWGDTTAKNSEKKLFLPSGIVVPFIEKKQLIAAFIHPFGCSADLKTTLIPGSLSPTMILGEDTRSVIFLQDLFDGLFLYQELNPGFCIIIHPDADIPLDTHVQKKIQTADHLFFCCTDSIQRTACQKIFPRISHQRFYLYRSKEELITLFQ